MWIKGFVKQSEEEAFLANVHVVSNINKYSGKIVGYMEMSNGNKYVEVKKHPSGTFNGQIKSE